MEIRTSPAGLEETRAELDIIYNDCKKENNFTQAQLKELRNFEFKGNMRIKHIHM